MTAQSAVLNDPNFRPVLNHGFVGLVDKMGDDDAIVRGARVSYGKGTKSVLKDRDLIRYLMRHRHTSPFELVQIKLHVKAPVFVIRQWFRHRTASVNELSARYSEMDDEFYLPAIEMIQPQSQDNKQGRGGELSDQSRNGVRWLMEAAYEHGLDTYNTLLGKRDKADFKNGAPIYDPYGSDENALLDEEFPGIARELARAVLPVGIYSEFYWSQNLHNLLHFLSLRTHGTAQWEIQQFAEAILDVVRPIAPMAVEAWEDYVRYASHFSKMETALMLKLIDPTRLTAMIAEAGDEKALRESLGMGVREWREFREKITA